MQTLHQEGHSAARCRPPSVSSAYRDARSRWDISFSASANNITGGNTLGDVLQTLIQFVSKPISNVCSAALMKWEGCSYDQMDATQTFPRTSVDTQRICHHYEALHSAKGKQTDGFKLLRGWANNLYTRKLNVGSNLKTSSKISAKEDKNYVY